MPVDGAPVLGPNPYVGAAASAASGAISLMNSLQAAHMQQLRLDAQKRQQDAARRLQETNDYNKYLNEGAIALDPVDDPPQATNGQPGRPTILSGQSKASAHDPNRVAEFPTIGRRLYIPTTGEKEEDKARIKQKYEGKNSVSLKGDLAQEAQASGYNVDPNQEYSPAAAGQIRQGIRDHNSANGVEIDTENFSRNGQRAVVRIDKGKGTYRELKPEDENSGTLQGRLGAEAGAQAAQSAMQGAAQAAAGSGNANDGTAATFPWSAPSETAPTVRDVQKPVSPNSVVRQKPAPAARGEQPASKPSLEFTPKPTKEAQPKSLHFEKDTNDSGDVTTAGYDPEKGTRVSSETRKGIGPKRKDPDAVTTKPAQGKPAQFQRVEKDKATAITKARQQWRKDLGEAITDDDRKSANDNYRTSVQDAQTNYEAGLKDLTGHDIAHNPWADNFQPGASGTSGSSASSTQAKTVTKAKLQAYVAAQQAAGNKKFSMADALREAQGMKLQVQ